MKAIFATGSVLITTSFIAGATTGAASEVFAAFAVISIAVLGVAIHDRFFNKEMRKYRQTMEDERELNRPRRNQK